ncbi:MAG: triose-phosphate isomerase [Phycisphaerales bacterium]|jgi:triosephosphate isomerase (TIM)|nr:triose-phosphate isomerase [Phycisphaerales bacterium]
MSRKLFIAGNWKMNSSAASSVEVAAGMASELGAIDAVDMAICPPFVYIPGVVEAFKGSNIGVGAQNMYFEDNGAFTGEISGQMLKDIGCRYVILGHSERRHVLGETDALINTKVTKALADELEIMFCVGELLDERKADQTTAVVTRQITEGLKNISREAMSSITIAYEPVWAIGTGETATPDQAQDVHATIRGLVGQLYDAEIADAVRIQYGGSVKPSNAAELLGCPDVDGALVGGASMTVADFAGIVNSVL